MTDQKLFISKKPNSHLIILMKVFIHGRFFFFFLKTSNGREKWRVTALCVTLGVTAFFSGEECVLEYRREIAFHFTW